MPRVETGPNDRAIVMLPYFRTDKAPRALVWIVPHDQNIPEDPDAFMLDKLVAESDIPVNCGNYIIGEATVVMLNGDEGYPVFDPDYDQHAICRCGHHYIRHFDWMEDYRPGCKYCDCKVFELDPNGGEKHPSDICIECHGNLDPDGKTCAKCRREVEPYSYELVQLRHTEAETRRLAAPPKVGTVVSGKGERYLREVLEVIEGTEVTTVRSVSRGDEKDETVMSVQEFNLRYEEQ